MTRQEMDALVEGHYRAEQAGDIDVRLLHVFDFADGLISRESAWLDVASLQRQLAEAGIELADG